MAEQARARRWRILPRTIRGLGIVFALASAAVTIALGMVTFVAVHREMERQIDQRIDAETDALLDYEQDHGLEAVISVVEQRDRRARPGAIGYLAGVDEQIGRTVGYIVTDATGRRRAGSLRAAMPPPGWSEFVHFVRADGSKGVAQALNSPLRSGGRLVVAGDRAALRLMDRRLLRFFAIAFGVLLLLGGVMVLLFGQIIRRRLAAIEASAQSIIAGDMSQRIPVDGSGVELDRLSILLNRMLEKIGALVENLKLVSNGLAHDLRTPLSRLRVKLERAMALSGDPEQQALLEAAIGESEEILELFSSLLAIAEIDGQHVRSRFVAVDLTGAAVEIAEAHRPAFEDAGIALLLDMAPAWVLGDRSLLQQMIANLLDNALLHASSATGVELEVAARDGKALVRVSDDGPGIPASERERVFERLVRLDDSRATPGHGLGLSMVAAIAAVHGGRAEVEPSRRGTTIIFEMPALAGAAAPDRADR